MPRPPRKPGKPADGQRRKPTGKKPFGRPAPRANDGPRKPFRPRGPGKPRPASLPAAGDDTGNDSAPGERLQKVLAASGIASRRECEELITEGRVAVDGQIVTELGARVDRRTQEIKVDGEPLARPRLVYFAVNKPAGVVTTARDPAGRPRVTDLLPPSMGRVFPVGRLDLESEGLILVTNDGALAERLTHPRHGVRKIYEVQVAGFPEPDVLAQLKRGVHLAEGWARALDIKVKGRRKKATILEMVLDEGRNREVRRLLARVGHKVQRLTRIAVGPIRLGELPRGAHRRLTQEEVKKLHDAGEYDRPFKQSVRPVREEVDEDRRRRPASGPNRPYSQGSRTMKFERDAGAKREGRPARPKREVKLERPLSKVKKQGERRVIGDAGDAAPQPGKPLKEVRFRKPRKQRSDIRAKRRRDEGQ